MLSVKQETIRYHFLSLWYDSTWDWTLVSQDIGEHSNHCGVTNSLQDVWQLLTIFIYFQKMFGKRPPMKIINQIQKDSELYKSGHVRGSQSNKDLHKAMNAHVANLKLLSGPIKDLQNSLPNFDSIKSKYFAQIPLSLKNWSVVRA